MHFAVMLLTIGGAASLTAQDVSATNVDAISSQLTKMIARAREVPKMRWVNQEGKIHGLLYEGEPYDGKSTEAFAFYASPKSIGKEPADMPNKHYPLDSYQKSFDVIPGPKQMRIEINMRHSHPAGWAPKEIGLFIDSYCRNGTPLPRLGDPIVAGNTVKVEYESPRPIASAAIHFTTETRLRSQRSWQSTAAEIREDIITAPKPAAECNTWFVSVTDDRGAMTTTSVLIQ